MISFQLPVFAVSDDNEFPFQLMISLVKAQIIRIAPQIMENFININIFGDTRT